MESKLSKREELAYRFYTNSTTGKVMPHRESKTLLIDAFLQADEFISMSGKNIHEVSIYNKLNMDIGTEIKCGICGKVITDFKNCVVKTFPVPKGESYTLVRHAYCTDCKPVK